MDSFPIPRESYRFFLIHSGELSQRPALHLTLLTEQSFNFGPRLVIFGRYDPLRGENLCPEVCCFSCYNLNGVQWDSPSPLLLLDPGYLLYLANPPTTPPPPPPAPPRPTLSEGEKITLSPQSNTWDFKEVRCPLK